jgi:hypothetical protein
MKIIGDSHLKGSATRISQYLNTKFGVCSFIKPGACTNQIVHSQEMEFMSLGRKDAIVIMEVQMILVTIVLKEMRL